MPDNSEYQDTKDEVESTWDEMKEIPDNILSNINDLEKVMRMFDEELEPLEQLLEFERWEIAIAYYDPEEPTFYQRTIFFHIHRTFVTISNYVIRMSKSVLFGTKLEEVRNIIAEFDSSVAYCEEELQELKDTRKIWDEHTENLAHAFHALPDDAHDADECNHEDCYTEEDMSEQYDTGKNDGKSEIENEWEINKDAVKMVFEVGGWSLHNALQDLTDESHNKSCYERLKELWLYPTTHGELIYDVVLQEQAKKDYKARFLRQFGAMKTLLDDVSFEQRQTILDFIETHFEVIENMLTHSLDLE